MRYFASVIVLLAVPVSAAAQHSPSLPSIGLPLPSIGLPLQSIGLPPEKPRPWDGRPHAPWWETRQLPPWEGGRVKRPDHVGSRVNVDVNRRGHRNNARVVYVVQPYPVAVQQEPQIIVVQQPPVTRIVEVAVPAPEPRVQAEPPPPAPEAPPYVPTGDRTLYVIHGCYVGNIHPREVKLPDTCDVTKVTTFNPSR
jgi:hypothetical protein